MSLSLGLSYNYFLPSSGKVRLSQKSWLIPGLSQAKHTVRLNKMEERAQNVGEITKQATEVNFKNILMINFRKIWVTM